MNRNHLLFLSMLMSAGATVAFAQHANDTPASVGSAQMDSAEAKQFDFLLGQWELQVHPKINSLVAMIHGAPKLVGTWKAWRAADGFGVEDELRIVDASGNPISLNTSVRTYAQAEGRWKITGLDVTHARNSEATAQWQDGEMHLDGQSTDADGKVTMTRTRYFDITAGSFRMQQDRSTDNGQSWDEAVVVIDAKRVSPSAAP